MRGRKSYSSQVKFQAALGLISGNQTVSELCQKYQIHQCVLYRWKKDVLEKGPETIFGCPKKSNKKDLLTVDDFKRKIGELTMDNDFLKRALNQ